MRRLPHPGAVCLALLLPSMARAEPLGDEWGTGERTEYYKITEIPVPAPHFIEAGCFATLPDGRVAVGTRRGDIFLVEGLSAPHPLPTFQNMPPDWMSCSVSTGKPGPSTRPMPPS
ncbi:MAG: hypothetical protein R3F31_14805 [Verrucomicrobiales bacterium]